MITFFSGPPIGRMERKAFPRPVQNPLEAPWVKRNLYQFANFSAKTTTAENCFICMSHHLPSTYVAVPGKRKITDCVSSCFNASDPQYINFSENFTKDGFQMITFEKSKLIWSVCAL
ncbi:hypothetical protein ILYODFUR_002425 [Ilyodon furcidens]|uniref:Uncharacterized protein n=1 Tax=Ilyodon furcidens TaxID=33524 RepID=A0ABV0VAG1_9TELE